MLPGHKVNETDYLVNELCMRYNVNYSNHVCMRGPSLIMVTRCFELKQRNEISSTAWQDSMTWSKLSLKLIRVNDIFRLMLQRRHKL